MTTVNTTRKCKNEISKYKKRLGTSGITGSLYRSHLLSLILSRNLNKETEFVLGCNVDGIGVMNEICLRFLHKENKAEQAAVFIKTKYTGHITDDDLTNAKSAFNLYKCYQSHILIKEKFDNDPDALFERKFNNITPYFVIYTPHQCKIKNHLVELKDDDEIFTDKVNSIIRTGNNNNIFKVGGDSLVTGLVNSTVELIGKTIAAYVTSDEKDRKETTEDMKYILKKYDSFLIPHVITINELIENCSAKFNKSIHENNNNHIKQLKKVLYTEILKKSKVIDEEASTNIQLLLEANEYTVDLLSALVGSVIVYDENTNKLAYVPGLSGIVKKPLDKIKVEKSIVDEAFVIAGKKALKSIKINFEDFDMRQIIRKEESEEESENVFEAETRLANQFLQNLYIYTDQVNENDIGKRVLEEIYISQATNKNTTIFKNKPEALLAKFHYKVQEWMLSMDKPQYLTNSCDFLKDNTNIVDPHLSILNYNCIKELQGYPIKFNSKSFNSFSKLVDTQSCTNIISNNVLLTSIKLMQYISNKTCLFVNFDHVYNMKNMEFNMVIQEINKSTVKTLVVIVCETEKYTTKSNKFREIVVNFPGNVYAITNHDIEDFETIYDTMKGLEDADNISDLLKHKITVQGEKVELGKVIDEKAIHVIDARILNKIIKNENIEIGQSFCTNSFYNELHFVVDRKLIKYNYDAPEHQSDSCIDDYDYFSRMSSKLDLSNEVFVIYAEPGMGKSTFFTHVSIQMKRAYPKTWIVRMNLLSFCEDFYNLEKEGIENVDIIKSMHLVCRAELGNKAFDNLFALERGSDGDLVLIQSKELDPIATLHLKLIIHCFNSGTVLFLFDGFDEICPHYEKVVLRFVKTFVNKDKVEKFNRADAHSSLQINNSRLWFRKELDISNEPKRENQIWISSRPYNVIKTTLEVELYTTSLYLKQLSIAEQYHFYETYWETQIKLEELNADQFKNVEAFYGHMNQYRLTEKHSTAERLTIPTNMLLRRMQEAAVKYFRKKIICGGILPDTITDKETLLDKWVSEVEMFTSDDQLEGQHGYYYNTHDPQLTGVPLHMKILADLFVYQIKDTSSIKQWDMGVHTFEYYKRFLELKLKIRLVEKAGESVNTSAFLTEYEDLVEEVTEEHKELAFYAFFHNASSHFKNVLPETQWIKIQSIIERIERVEEKTGLVDRIHNGVPQFVHLIFAEHFAVEFIADMLKRNPLTDDQVHRQIDFVVNCLFRSSVGILKVFDHKIKNDENLRKFLDKDYTMKCLFTNWIEQDELNIHKESCLKKVIKNKVTEVCSLLPTNIKDTLNFANLEKLVDSIDSDCFRLTIKSEDQKVNAHFALDAIRSIDPATVLKALLPVSHSSREDISDNLYFFKQL